MCEMSKSKVIRFALVGCGSFGRYIGPFADGLPALSLEAVCDPSEECRELAKGMIGREVPAFETLEECLARAGEGIDAVMLTSPNGVHCEQAVAAAEAGKHVFCEKPMAIDTAECRRMVDAAEAAGVKLVVGHKRRLRPPFVRAKELALSGELGEPVAIQLSTWHYYQDIPDWWLRREQCGGLLHRVGVHDVDFMRAVLGDVDVVTAFGVKDVTGEADYDECLTLSMRFRSGAIGSLQAGFRFGPLHFRESCAPWIQCTKGGVRVATFGDHIDVFWGPDPDHLEHERFDDLGQEAAYRAELMGFAEWILEGKTPVLSWEEGLRCVEVMEAAYRSAAQDGAAVSLPLAGH